MNVKKIIILSLAFLTIAGVPVISEFGPCAAAEVKAKLDIEAQDDQFTHLSINAKPTGDGIAAKGTLALWNGNDTDKIKINISYLLIDGQYAWLAGKCVDSSGDFADRWVYVVVHDGGEPGRLVDHIWIEWLAEGQEGKTQAEQKVVNLDSPSKKISIESGDIKVDD